MKKVILFLLISVSLNAQLSISTNSFPSKVKVFLDFGQSNCEGGASTCTVAPYTGQQPGWIYKTNSITEYGAGSFATYKYGINNDYNSGSLNNTGSEVALCYNYNLQTGDSILIIKYGYSGSGLVDNGIGTCTYGLWQIDANATRANNLLHYKISLDKFIFPCIALLKSKGITPEFIGMGWTQGEYDVGDSLRTVNYEYQLNRLVQAYKDTLTYYGVCSPTFKPLIGRTPYSGTTLSTKLRTAQQNVAATWGTTYIDMDSYEMLVDGIHFSFNGQIQYGIDRVNVIKFW